MLIRRLRLRFQHNDLALRLAHYFVDLILQGSGFLLFNLDGKLAQQLDHPRGLALGSIHDGDYCDSHDCECSLLAVSRNTNDIEGYSRSMHNCVAIRGEVGKRLGPHPRNASAAACPDWANSMCHVTTGRLIVTPH